MTMQIKKGRNYIRAINSRKKVTTRKRKPFKKKVTTDEMLVTMAKFIRNTPADVIINSIDMEAVEKMDVFLQTEAITSYAKRAYLKPDDDVAYELFKDAFKIVKKKLKERRKLYKDLDIPSPDEVLGLT